ncbi:MAG: 50S ribosomal protein L24 [Patescibacteria group bacterium]
MKIRKGDKIRVLVGKDKGREGVVEKVYKKQDVVMIPGINLYKKHIRKNEKMPQGGVVEIPRPMAISKVILICPKCKQISKVGFQIDKNKKTRICKKCKSVI